MWLLILGLVVFVSIALSRAKRALTELAELRQDVAVLTRRLSALQESLAGSEPRATMAARAPGAAPSVATESPTVVPQAPPSPAVAREAPIEPVTPLIPPAPTPATTLASATPVVPSVTEPVIAAGSTPSSAPVEPPPSSRPAPAQPVRPPRDRNPVVAKWLEAAREWLFGGNLVAKIGLLILFIGVSFLVRLASGVLPVEVKLAAAAAGAIALLVWAWRIRESRRGIALPAQGAALAILMLVTFGAFKLFGVLPGSAAFALLFLLIVFTCALAVMQDAVWLAVFGISGGFAAPILTSSGDGNYIALFSYYALLNAGILGVAWYRSWRALNVLGFLFTFVVGAAWGEQRYVAENFASAEFFLVLFWVFYIAIAVMYAWRRAPELKSYVDGTLVFGVPMAGMALQYGLVKEMPFGMAISALTMALVYAFTASALWRWRQGTLRLLVESFLALAIAFGTLAIPLALDGRWTSAAWAVEGAAIVWVGLKQRRPLAWQFGVAVQVGSWIAFIASLAGVDSLRALRGPVGLSFGLLGVTGVLLALLFRKQASSDADSNDATTLASRLAAGFVTVAVIWLLLGMWVEVWSRMQGAARATLLVATALVLVYGLQWLARRSVWRLVQRLSVIVLSVAGVVFAVLVILNMRWYNVAEYSEASLGQLLAGTPFLGGLMLCAGSFFSALAFKRVLADRTDADSSVARGPFSSGQFWWFATLFWWSSCVLYSLSHAVGFLTTAQAGESSWYEVSFWSAYAVGLALSVWGWTALAQRVQLPLAAGSLPRLWLRGSFVAAVIFAFNVAGQLWWQAASMPGVEALRGLLGGPLLGALLLVVCFWAGATHASGRERRAWLLGLGAVWFLLLLDGPARYVATLLYAREDAWWRFDAGEAMLLLVSASGMLFVRFALHAQGWRFLQLRWLAVPAALSQAWISVAFLAAMYGLGTLPSWHAGLALAGCWLAMLWILRVWRRNHWLLPHRALQALHFGRVIAPWLMVAPLVSLGTWRWLAVGTLDTTQAEGWVIAGKWPDYLAAWVAIGTLLLLLRQARRGGRLVEPLHAWYLTRLIPLATLWGVSLAVYWNLRQDGSMEPLPYLPILNPLDVTTGFVALLVARVWQANRASLGSGSQLALIRISGALAFGWFNGMLLRTAAKMLELPYRFEPLYHSQFVQAMLAIVWTLSAFLLMRLAVRRLSKPLWMVGAGLLAVVVIKLFLVDLSAAGSVARIVSFMGVGALMLVIGYLAPLPRTASGESEVRA